MKGVIPLLLLAIEMAFGQPEVVFKDSFWVAVEDVSFAGLDSLEILDWPVYANPERTQISGRLQPGQIVKLTGSAKDGLPLFIVADDVSGYVSYSALTLNGIYWKGMPDEVTRYSLGNPDTVIPLREDLDQWIYRKHDVVAAKVDLYLYFSKGVLTFFKNVRK